ncbi:MAG: dodecin family protein [Chloroflexi bacterium]|nr:dodecin family protein [Chloroflexota bacterium]
MTETSDKVYRLVEVTGTSAESMEQAMQNAISKASKSIPQMEWFELMSTRGTIRDGKIAGWRVTIKIRAVV